MFLKLENLLNDQEIARLRELAGQISFVDGRSSNPHSKVKTNRQADTQLPATREASQILIGAYGRSGRFADFALPQTVAPPLLTRYEPGMQYGEHIDAAEIQIGNAHLRTDLSSTVFINDPESYEGGELSIRLGDSTVEIKGKPGEAIVYPSTTYHQVKPVTKGERLVAITFIQSALADNMKREMLFELGELYGEEAENVSWENRVRLEFVQQNLKRMWL